MTQAIRAVYNGEKYISPLIKSSTGDKGDFNSLLELLSRRERQILQMLISSKRQKDIAKELNLSPKTVSTYVNRLYVKLKVDNLVDLAKLMLNCGFDEQAKS
jgi:DNA-binding NarL/FixJ family response regulator